jgi:hypothetical protein
MLEDVQELMTEIVQALHAELQDDDVVAKMNVRMIDGHYEQSTDLYDAGQNEKSIATETEFDVLFKKLRVKMYATAPEKGGWYVANVTVDENGKFSFNFDYDDKTQFNIMPDDEEFSADLRLFPRTGL